jgi:hypothetical protein
MTTETTLSPTPQAVERLTVADVLRAIWELDSYLISHVPATTSASTNRFFQEGMGFLEPRDIPHTFVAIQDDESVLIHRASGGVEHYKHSVIITIASPSKNITIQLARIYEEMLNKHARGRHCDEGVIFGHRFESRKLTSMDNGLRLWTGQLNLLIQGTRRWHIPR